MLAGAVVWAWPSAKVADPLIAFLFAIIVAMTTIYLLRESLSRVVALLP